MEFLHLVRSFGPYIFAGLKYTAIVTIASVVGSVGLGLVLAFGRLSRRRWLSWPVICYIEIMRATPVLLVLLVVYLGLPIRLSPVQAAVIAFAINGAAYMAEIFRSGIQSVERGQVEASTALGMPHAVMMRRIILPQAVYVTLPPAANFGVDMLKASSLALVITVPEITYRAYNAIGETFQTIYLLTIAAVIYVGVGIPLARAVHALERHYERKR